MGRTPPGALAREPGIASLEHVVPSRAVLTELARGFLMMQDRDPGRAVRFASTFLKEQQPPDEPRVALLPRLPQVRRPTAPSAPAPGWDDDLPGL